MTQDWTAVSVSRIAWGQVRPQPEAADGGIDFEFQFNDTHPMIFSEDRPLLFMSSISEGNP